MSTSHIHGPSVRDIPRADHKFQQLVCAAAVGMSWDGDPRLYAVVEYLGDGKWNNRVSVLNSTVKNKPRSTRTVD